MTCRRKVPSFPLQANIWSRGSGPPAVPRLITAAQLRGPWPVTSPVPFGIPGGGSSLTAWMSIPAHTDIRDGRNASGADVVEIPSGSSVLYDVIGVSDIAKGFPNEFRIVLLGPRGGVPTPTP